MGPMFNLPDDLLARYEPLESLGQSQTSMTQKVRDRDTQDILILKSIALSQASSWKQLELFRREARTLSQLDHPHIPRLWNYIEALENQPPSCHLLLEHLPGTALSTHVYKKGPLPVASVVQIAAQVLDVLKYLHGYHPPVIHRDIKPSNLLWEDGVGAYLIDFGGTQKSLAEGETLVGTYGYMAPEQFAGKAETTSDLYALGTTLIFLLSGYEPANLAQKDMCLQFRPVVDCPSALADWIEQLIQPDPRQRFHHAEAALEVLKALFPELSLLPLRQTEVTTPLESLPQITLPTASAMTGLPEGAEDTTSPKNTGAQVLMNKYRLVKQIRQRDAVTTYEATHILTGKPLIVKTIAFHLLTHWKDYELFERELKVLEQLEHPGIPGIMDSFELHVAEGHLLCMVREHIQGQTLEDLLAQGWRPKLSEVYSIAQQLLDILVFLHERTPPVVHRDIKPSNIIYTPHKKIHLIDFGALHEHFKLKFTGGSTVVGTLGYMSPEQSTGHTTPASDLYSTGLTLIHLLSGIHPSELPHHNLEIQFEERVNCSPAMTRWLKSLSAAHLRQRFKSAASARKALNELDTQALILSDKSIERPRWYFKPDAPMKIKESFSGLELEVYPLAHEDMLLKGLGAALTLCAMFAGLAISAWAVMLAFLLVPAGTFVMVQRAKQQGAEHKYTLHIDKDFFTYHAYREVKEGDHVYQETLDRRVHNTQDVSALFLFSEGVKYTMVVQVSPMGGGTPSSRSLKMPIANNAYQAQFILERLRETLKYYQKKRP